MKRLKFKPRKTFNADLKKLASLDHTIIDEVRAKKLEVTNEYKRKYYI